MKNNRRKQRERREKRKAEVSARLDKLIDLGIDQLEARIATASVADLPMTLAILIDKAEQVKRAR